MRKAFTHFSACKNSNFNPNRKIFIPLILPNRKKKVDACAPTRHSPQPSAHFKRFRTAMFPGGGRYCSAAAQPVSSAMRRSPSNRCRRSPSIL